MAKKKYYVVWVGRQTGIFETWEDCNEQIFGFPKAQYKSFKTKELAEKAFNSSSKEFIGKDIFETVLTPEQLELIGEPIKDSISVDGAWNTATGIVEYHQFSSNFVPSRLIEYTSRIAGSIDLSFIFLPKSSFCSKISL